MQLASAQLRPTAKAEAALYDPRRRAAARAGGGRRHPRGARTRRLHRAQLVHRGRRPLRLERGAGGGGSLSLFADKQIVEIRIPSEQARQGRQRRAAADRRAARANDSTPTLVMLPRLDKATRTGAWSSALENSSQHRRSTPMERARCRSGSHSA